MIHDNLLRVQVNQSRGAPVSRFERTKITLNSFPSSMVIEDHVLNDEDDALFSTWHSFGFP